MTTAWKPSPCAAPYRQVSAFADSVIAQSEVRHGNIHIVQVEVARPSLAEHRHLHFHSRT